MTMWRLYRLDVNVVPANSSGFKGCLATLQEDVTRERVTLHFDIGEADLQDPPSILANIDAAFGATYTPNDFT